MRLGLLARFGTPIKDAVVAVGAVDPVVTISRSVVRAIFQVVPIHPVAALDREGNWRFIVLGILVGDSHWGSAAHIAE